MPVFKEKDKVRAPVKDKFVSGTVQKVEDCKGFRGYKYQKVWVTFEDETVGVYRDFDLYLVTENV